MGGDFIQNQTLFLDANNIEDNRHAASILKQGGIVAIPTETVYGLAANALEPLAVQKIFIAKGRPQDNPLIVHICDYAMLHPLIKTFPKKAKQLCDAFWPGAFTVILPKSELVPNITSGGLATVAVRMPSNATALDVIALAGVPLAAPSANISGTPSPTCANHCKYDLNGKIDAILDGGTCEIGLESTVVSVQDDVVTLLRPGAITLEQLREVVGEICIGSGVMEELHVSDTALSPGMKYKHYSPKSKLILVNSTLHAYEKLVNNAPEPTVYALCFEGEEKNLTKPFLTYGKKEDATQQAHALFDALRTFDQTDATLIYARIPNQNGVGLAVYNRMLRCAGFEILTLDEK